MKIRRGKFSGAIGNEVYVNDPHGQVVRSRPHRPWARTTRRRDALANLSQVAELWRTLTEKQFAAWTVAGKKEKKSGYRLFCQINGALKAAGEPLVMDPPKREKMRPNPVGKLEILNRGGVIRLRLRVPRAPAKLTFVFSWKAVSRGRLVWSTYAKIGRLPEAERGWSDITELYVKRFGVPAAGLRVFIQTQQLVNGREDDFKKTNAVVPQAEGEGG